MGSLTKQPNGNLVVTAVGGCSPLAGTWLTEAAAAKMTAPSVTPAASAADESVQAEKPEPKTPLDALAKDGESGSSFSISDGDAWALYPGYTTECGTDVDGHTVRLDQAEAKDEFEGERLKNAKGDLVKKFVGTFVEFRGSGDASGDGFTVGDFNVSIGKYNFAAHQYTLTISATDESKWPLSGQSPNLVPESMTTGEDREIAKLGGKSLTVEGERTMTHFINKSSMTIPVKVPTAEAEEMKSSAPTDVLLVMRFAGLGYHKSCRNDCSELLGTRTCVGVNDGFGQFYRADLVGYRIELKDKVVAEKQPPAGMVKK